MTARALPTTLLLLATLAGVSAADEQKIDYARDVAPLLKRRCLDCHGPEEQESAFRVDSRRTLLRGGDIGEPAIVPGKSGESYLIKLVSGDDPDLAMPPEGDRLTAAEIKLLRDWIDQGATMPEDELGKLTTDHWSFQPVQRPKVPADVESAWIGNPIDAFVLAKLQEAGLEPGDPSDPISLARRIYLVMHGLPPTPKQVDDFAANASDQAYEQLVERILDSPRYGERWAQHWLDLIRFGETQGFETNRERPNAWYYRDYVVDSLNDDLPYDDFIKQQIAGDALGVDLATGFLVAGPNDLVKSQDINLTLMQRQDELGDIINTTGTAFLGLTLGCARCHSHKFDPVTQRDYYSIQAVFAGVQHGERALSHSADVEPRLAELKQQIADLNNKLERFIPPTNERVVLVDDDMPYQPRRRGVEQLGTPNGKGANPAGTGRGERDDPGDETRIRNVSGGKYTWWTNEAGKPVIVYRFLTTGKFRVWLSWGSGHNTHTNDAEYVLDHDGDLETTNDQQLIATIDQQQFAGGSGPLRNQSLWSGLIDAGVHDFSIDSAIFLRGGKTGTAITADVIVLENSRRAQPIGQARGPLPNPLPEGEGTSAPQPSIREPVNHRHNVERIPATKARFVRFTTFATNNGSEPCLDELELFSGKDNVALDGKPTCSSALPGHEIHKLEHINDGKYGNGRSWISNEPGAGWVQIEFPEATTIDRIEWARDRQDKYRDRVPTRYVIETAVEEGKWSTVAGSDDRLPFTGELQVLTTQYRFTGLAEEEAEQGKAWYAELQRAEAEYERLTKPQMAYAGTFSQPGPTHRLYRGDPMAKREEVVPDALEVLGTLGLESTTPEQERRIEFAEWIASPNNPLTARVIVNRIWQHHFGVGLVDTPSDFGANGTLPTHPKLLDWLADELVQNGWSLKHLQRLILMSNTFRQANTPRDDALAVDAASRLLWRFPPRRLEAEAIRDSILAVSGVLDSTMGGPGFSGFEVQMENVRHYFPKTSFGPGDWRRMIYMTKVRQEKDAIFGAFDCPDLSQVMPKRSRSTTPLQALNLFNSEFMLQQADLLAKRLEKEAGDEPAEQTRLAFLLCLGREPDDDELELAAAFLNEHGSEALARALFNANEFLFIP